MSVQVYQGVSLTILPTQKYKTTRIMVRFQAPVEKKMMAARGLLSSLLQTNSADYPDQTKIQAQLAYLYGANLSIDVVRRGNRYYFSLYLDLVQNRFVSTGEDLVAEGLAFLEAILFRPNLEGQAFHAATFAREKEVLLGYLDANYEDKQGYANQALQELFFEGYREQQIDADFGTREDLSALTPETVFQEYQKMLREDQIAIFITGEANETAVLKQIESWPLADRNTEASPVFFEKTARTEAVEKVEKVEAAQAKLNLGYRIPAYYYQPEYFAALVLNGLFGGFSHSKLFTNVREKASLAYTVGSQYDAFRGLLTVRTGIDSKDKEQAQALIREQLEAIQQGVISEQEWAQTKAMLKNQFKIMDDYAQSMIEKAYSAMTLPGIKNQLADILAAIEDVTQADVQALAQQVVLEATYFMEGKTL